MVYREELAEISSAVEEMYSSVIQNIEMVLAYYQSSRPKDLSFIVDDDKINNQERNIESLCMQLLLKQTVYSSDFREVVGALKMIECLERVGDNAYDIKGMADDIKDTPTPLPIEGTDDLIRIVLSMLRDGFTALIREDIALSQQIIARDDKADKTYWNLVQLLAEKNDHGQIDGHKTVYESHVVKYLERIGDQSTNIAEWVIYIQTGFHKDRVII